MVIDIAPSWKIRYSKYVGDLTLFDEDIYDRKTSDLELKKVSDCAYVTLDKIKNVPVMVEIGNAEVIIPNIDNMEKDSIINKVKEYLYAK